MPKIFTPEQERAITERDRTLLVSAAAGSGKTATLTERIVRLVTDKEHPADLSRLLIATFTRAAARELRDRISAALTAALERDPSDVRLSRQLLLLPAAHISTIDSFSVFLLRRYADAAGLPSRFRLADEAEAALLSRRVMDETLDRAYAGNVPGVTAAAFSALADTFTDVYKERELADRLEQLYNKVITYPEKTRLLADIGDRMTAGYDGGDVFATSWGAVLREETFGFYRAALKDFSDCADAIRNAGSDNEQNYLPVLEKELSHIRTVLAAPSYTAVREELLSFAKERKPNRNKNDATEAGDAYGPMRDAFFKEKDRFAPKYAYEEAEYLAALQKTGELHKTASAVLTAFDEAFTEEKLAAGICTFNDVKHRVYRLLVNDDGTPTEIALEVRKEYDAVYVDEYQDVDMLQHKIFEVIAGKRCRFMVGDVKQSIYGFRGARPDIFSALRRKFAPLPADPAAPDPAEATAFLSRNFRSDEPILRLTNRVCGALFRAVGGEVEYLPEDDLVVGKEDGTENTKLPTLTVFPAGKSTDGDDDPDPDPDDTGEEFAAVADRIAALLANGKKRVVKEDEEHKKTVEYVPIEPKDIAVLCRSHTKMPKIEDALSSRGIPFVSTADRQFFLNPEILLVLSLLNAINNPHRDVYFAGLLCSPIYGYTMDELLRLRAAYRKEPLYDAFRLHAQAHPDDARASRVLADLARYRRMAEGQRADRLLRVLYRETGLAAMAGTQENARENLLLLYNFARTFESGTFRGLYRFIHYVNEVIRENRTFRTPDNTGTQNAVSVMTVHASKGLQFPVVFLAAVSHSFAGESNRLCFDPALGFAADLQDDSGFVRQKSPVAAAIREAVSAAEREEEIRLLYVALTRPIEQLHVSGSLSRMKQENAVLSANELRSHLSRYAILHARGVLEWLMACADDSVCELKYVERPTEEENVAEEATDSPTCEEKPQNSEENVPTNDPITEDPADREAETERLASLLRERFTYPYPYKEQTLLPGKLSVSRLTPEVLDRTDDEWAEVARRTENRRPAFLSGAESAADPGAEAAAAGTATHCFLQFCDLTRLCEQGAEAELARLTQDAFLSPEDASRVRLDEIRRFAASPICAEMIAAKALHREFRFHMALPAESLTADRERKERLAGERVLIQGVIDCLFETKDGKIVLLDYKTDRLTREELADPALAAVKLRERHGKQLAYYAAAVRQIFGRLPDRALIYSLPLGATVDSDVNNYLQIISYGKDLSL